MGDFEVSPLLAKADMEFSFFSCLPEEETGDRLALMAKPDLIASLIESVGQVDRCEVLESGLQGFSLGEDSSHGTVSFSARLSITPSQEYISDEEILALQDPAPDYTPDRLELGNRLNSLRVEIGDALALGFCRSFEDQEVSLSEKLAGEVWFTKERQAALSSDDQVALVSEMFSTSRSETRRLMINGAMRVNGQAYQEGMSLSEGDEIQIGRNRKRTI